MSMFARLPNGDLAFPLAVVQDPTVCTVQKITDEFNLWRGAWVFDVTQGFPWLQQVLGLKNPSLNAIRSLFRKALLATPRVIAVTSLNFGFDNQTRDVRYAWTAQLDTSQVIAGGAGASFSP